MNAILLSEIDKLKMKLAHVTLTTARGDRDEVRAAANALVARSAEGGVAVGALLVRDVGADHGGSHLHGLFLGEDPERFVEEWEDLTGGTREHQDHRPIRGWDRWAEGVDDELVTRVNVRNVLAYDFKPLPFGHDADFDTDADVASSGLFCAPWDGFRRAVGVIPRWGGFRPSPSKERSRTCKCGCDRSLDGRRSDADFATDACRKRLQRRDREKAEK